MPVRSPRRTRGERTLNRLVEAAADLLETKALEAISIAEVARRAGVSVGSFYTWFESKEDLLPHLYRKYDGELEAESARLLAPERFVREPLEGRVAALVGFCVRLYRTRRGLYRAALLHAATTPDSVDPETRRRRRTMIERAAALLAGNGDEIAHPDPLGAAEFALCLVMSSLKDRVLLEEAARGIVKKLSDRRLAAELERAVLAYLRSAAKA